MRGDVPPPLSYVTHRAGNLGLFYLCASMLLPSNGEHMVDACEDMESALWAAGTRTFPSLLVLQEELVIWKPDPVGYNTCMQCSLALDS